jgi:ABC-type molybdate transport system substrate-binding protein
MFRLLGEAAAFLAFLTNPQSQEVFIKYGFTESGR